MSWVDVVLVGLVALAAIHGLRLGAVVQVLTYGGFWIGLLIGAVATPPLARLVHGSFAKTLVAGLVVFGFAGIFGAAGRVVGTRSSIWLHRLRFGPVDSVLGVAVGVVATMLVFWIVASTLENSRFTAVDQAISRSRIVRAMDSLLPPPPQVFSQIETFLSDEGFPVVFQVLPSKFAGPVPLPSNDQYRKAVASARLSTVQIEGQGCGVIQAGSGFVVAPGIVVTNAHVVAGIQRPEAINAFGATFATQPIWFDPELDLAVLEVPGLTAPVVDLDTQLVSRGTGGAVLGYPYGGPFRSGLAGVEAEFKATGLDIYGTKQTDRDVYQLEANIEPGNSGGPFVEPDGVVAGVVFARSTTNSNVGYALASPAVLAEVDQAVRLHHQTATGSCAQ